MLEFLSVEFGTSDVLMGAYLLRYELVCCVVCIALWLMTSFAGILPSRRPPQPASKLGVETPWQHSAVEKRRQWLQLESRPAYQALDLGDKFATAGSTAELLSYLKSMNQTSLCDPAWVAQQISKLCRTRFQHALTVYHTARQAGLKLQEVSPAECQQLFMNLVTSAIRVGFICDARNLLKELRDSSIGVSESLFSSVVKLCTAKHLFDDCLTFYDVMKEDTLLTLSDMSIWSCLLFCAIEARAYQRCNTFFKSLKSLGTPSQKDYGNMVRLASFHDDWQLCLRLIREMRECCVAIDSVICNTCLATCVHADQMPQGRLLLEEMVQAKGVVDVISFNTVMKGYAKAGNMDQCFELFDWLQTQNISPSPVTYGILLDGCVNENLLDKAIQVFDSIVSTGCQMNTVLFTTLIKGFIRAGKVDQAMDIYQQMRTNCQVSPDLVTFSILIKANCDSDHLDKALKLLEDLLGLGIKPDDVVFNSLLAGCARQSCGELGKRIYADMVAIGVRPSNATFSVLIRLHHQCKRLDEAVEMLRTEPVSHGIEPEPRLYTQLIQACIRERQGQRAVNVYGMMLEQTVPTIAAHSAMIGTCLKLNMYDTAAEILAMTARYGGRIDPNDASSLLEVAIKKRKYQVAIECAAAMKLLGILVDPKLLAHLKSNWP